MDICLNISTNVVAKKPLAKYDNNNTSIKRGSSKGFKPKVQPQNNTFEFKWDTNKKTAKPFVKNNNFSPKKVPTSPQKAETKSILKTGNKFSPKKVQPTEIFSKSLEKSIDDPPPKKKSQNDGFLTTEHFQKHGFPLFNNFSEAATGTALENLEGESKQEQVFSKKGRKFCDLGIHPHTVTNLERIGLTVLTAVQEKAIPQICSGKNVFVRSQTGSGKTLAYAIPIVESLRSIEPHINRKDGIQALIVVPTRELALQTYELFLKLVEPFRWIVPGRLCGGENRNSEKARLRKGISVLIGTPGRLLDHALHTQNLKLDKVRCLILDEADRLLDMGFQKDVNKLIELINDSKNLHYDPLAIMKSRSTPTTTPNPEPTPTSTIPPLIPPLVDLTSKSRQTILLSATLTSNVKDLATFTLTDYIYIDPLNSATHVDINNLPDQSDAEVVIPQSVNQEFVVTDVKTKLVVLSAFIVSKARDQACKMFVFMASRQMVEFHEALFKKCLVKRPKKEGRNEGVKIVMEEEDESDEEDEVVDLEIFKLHGSMDQRERTEVFKAFRAANKGVLLCTTAILLRPPHHDILRPLDKQGLTDYIYIDPLNSTTHVDINNLPDQSDAEVIIPQSVNQEFVVTDVKTKLVVLSAFIVSKARDQACKMFVFMASRQMVEFHEALFKKCLVKRPKKEGRNEGVKIVMEEEDESDEEDEVVDLEIFKLHGSMDQRERTEVFKAFRAANKGVLLCTDVAARGVDIPHADYVVQYTSPLQDEDYIHRAGRTGRVGKKGLALLFLTEPEMNYVMHLKEKNIILKRQKQDNILKNLMQFMEHASPGSVQSAAEILQRRFEKAVLKDKNLHSAACMAYSSWSRYYSSYPQALRQYFSIKNTHLGHYVTSFALRESPQQVGRTARNEIGKTGDARLNKKLDNHERDEPKVAKPLRPKKRPRDQELVMSEFDSGLPKSKKKK